MSWISQWNQFTEDARGVPLDIRAQRFAGPASPESVQRIEDALTHRLPPRFRAFLLGECGGIEVNWYFEDGAEVQLPGEPESITAGGFEWKVDDLLQENPRLRPGSGFCWDEYSCGYWLPDTLAFASTPNGDQFAVVCKGPAQDSIVYLNHDLGDIHGYRVGDDLPSFLTHYARLGFAGPEYWVWEQFTDKRTTPINSGSASAIVFLEHVRTGRRSLETEVASHRAADIARQVRFKHIIEPEARRLIEDDKAGRNLVNLLQDYEDLLTGTLKKRYERAKQRPQR